MPTNNRRDGYAVPFHSAPRFAPSFSKRPFLLHIRVSDRTAAERVRKAWSDDLILSLLSYLLITPIISILPSTNLSATVRSYVHRRGMDHPPPPLPPSARLPFEARCSFNVARTLSHVFSFPSQLLLLLVLWLVAPWLLTIPLMVMSLLMVAPRSSLPRFSPRFHLSSSFFPSLFLSFSFLLLRKRSSYRGKKRSKTDFFWRRSDFFFFKKEETSWRVGKVWIGRRESLENRVDHRFNFSSNSFLSVYGKSVSLNPLLNGPGFGSGVTHIRERICNGNLYFLLQIKERILRKFWGEWKWREKRWDFDSGLIKGMENFVLRVRLEYWNKYWKITLFNFKICEIF